MKLVFPSIQNQLKRIGLFLLVLLLIFTGKNLKAQCVSPDFPASAEILANVPEASAYNLVYKLPIQQQGQNWLTQSDIPYSVNNSALLSAKPYSRIAYYMKLESNYFGPQWVWVSMDAFTNDIGLISIPTGNAVFQQVVHNMNVMNHTGVNKTNIDGNIEFWQHCYTNQNAAAVPGASDDYYDFGDAINPDLSCTYGSFQVHDFNAQKTEFAYNGWSYADGCDDVGIGNLTEGQPDWTLYNNSCYYSLSELYVFVDARPTASCKMATVSLDASGIAVVTPSMLSDLTAGSCGITDVSISKSTFTCADAGDNKVTVTVTDNLNNSTTCTTIVTVTDNHIPVITATGRSFNAGCNPSAASINDCLGTATVADNCAGATLNVSDGTIVVNSCTYSQTRTWTATDAFGNVATAVSRTITWKVDNAAPVITATGASLSLSCNPSAASIEAALGTATVTDNCGAPTFTSSTGGVIVSGNTSSQTRTWTAVDACNNNSTVSRTVTWTNQCEHIFASTVTCSQYLAGQSAPLTTICYKNLLNIVTGGSPGSFYYYTTVTAPATLGTNASFNVDVLQTKACSGFRFYNVSKITATDINCTLKATGTEVNAGQGRVTITGAVAGKVYVIAVKYDTSPLLLSSFPLFSAAPTCQNTFVSKISTTGSSFGSGATVAGSEGSIKAIPNCSPSLLSINIILNKPSVPEQNLALEIAAMPNPSNNYFNINIKGSKTAPASMRIVDIYGRVIEVKSGINANSTVSVGHKWPVGNYIVEVIQGDQRKTMKIIKTK